MFSREDAVHSAMPSFPDVSGLILTTLSSFLRENALCAGFLCRWNEDAEDASLVAVEGIPDTPFKGSKHGSLVALLKNCLKHYPAPHVHSISSSQLWRDISSLQDIGQWHRRALFIPGYSGQLDFILLCFAESSVKLELTEEIAASATDVINTAAFLLSAERQNDRLRVMEIYVREVGHDIASSVQAIVSKLRNVSRGLLEGKAAITKIIEAEAEIMSAYRVADTLGITVDPDYNIGTGGVFDAKEAISQIIELCRSEAAERHIVLEPEYTKSNVSLWGDEKAIQSAILQLIMNAIKYAKGSSSVKVRVKLKNKYVEFSVTDLGKPLGEDEKAHMWEFGWRGEKAKELHVNGSGIGLYTVKKIVQAHGGIFGSHGSGKKGDIVTFFFQIPKRELLSKTKLL